MPQTFETRVDYLADRAFEDQCTTANPRMPLVTELADVYRNAFYGKFEYAISKGDVSNHVYPRRTHHEAIQEIVGSWRGFQDGKWKQQVNVKDFIEQNITPYDGNGFPTRTYRELRKHYGRSFEANEGESTMVVYWTLMSTPFPRLPLMRQAISTKRRRKL